MFLDTRDPWPPPQWEPPAPRPARLSKPAQGLVGALVLFNLVLLLVAPLAGASLVDMVLALMH